MRAKHPLLLAALLVAGVMLLPEIALGQPSALVALQSPSDPSASQPFTTEVTIAEAQGLLGFQFDVNFDPAALSVEAIELGPFLGSTGRSARPLGPDERAAAEGRVVYGGFTLGDQEGAAGSGVLATITWRALSEGQTQVSLDKVQLAGSGGSALSHTVGDAVTVVVGETSPAPASPAVTDATPEANQPAGLPVWLLAMVVVVVVGIVGFLLVRRSGSSSSQR